jgi:hypothetical protein
MKNILISIVTVFTLIATPSVVSAESAFNLKMKNAGFRWIQNMDNLNGFQNGNGLRLFSTVYVGSKSHEVTVMYNRQNMSGPWDLFQNNDRHLENMALEYRYNFN